MLVIACSVGQCQWHSTNCYCPNLAPKLLQPTTHHQAQQLQSHMESWGCMLAVSSWGADGPFGGGLAG